MSVPETARTTGAPVDAARPAGLVEERIGRVAHARIDNPRRRNAITDSAVAPLIALVGELQTGDSARRDPRFTRR